MLSGRLVTTLQRQRVPIKTAQAILRHAYYDTTANHYVKIVEADAVEAMALVEKACNERAMEAFEASSATVVN